MPGYPCCCGGFTECGIESTPGDLAYIIANFSSVEIDISRSGCPSGGTIDCSPISGIFILDPAPPGFPNVVSCPNPFLGTWIYHYTDFGAPQATGCSPSQTRNGQYILEFSCGAIDGVRVNLWEHFLTGCAHLCSKDILFPLTLAQIMSGAFDTFTSGSGFACEATAGTWLAS